MNINYNLTVPQLSQFNSIAVLIAQFFFYPLPLYYTHAESVSDRDLDMPCLLLSKS